MVLHLCFMQPLLFASTALGLCRAVSVGSKHEQGENGEQRLGAAEPLHNGILLPSG